MNKKKNSPAFPCSGALPREQQGMTLRDYFAAKAMAAIIIGAAANKMLQLDDVEIAKQSYAAADSMLAERAK